MSEDYTDPPAGYREEPAVVPGTDECNWREKTMGENYEDDIDEVKDLPPRE